MLPCSIFDLIFFTGSSAFSNLHMAATSSLNLCIGIKSNHLRWSPAARCSWCSGKHSRSSAVWGETPSTGWCGESGDCVFPLFRKRKCTNYFHLVGVPAPICEGKHLTKLVGELRDVGGSVSDCGHPTHSCLHLVLLSLWGLIDTMRHKKRLTLTLTSQRTP